MSDNLMHRITNDPPGTVFEAGIVTALSYFLDKKFLVSINLQFPVGQQPIIAPLPANWRNNISMMPQGDGFARFYIRKNHQIFGLSFTYDSSLQKVMASPIVSS